MGLLVGALAELVAVGVLAEMVAVGVVAELVVGLLLPLVGRPVGRLSLVLCGVPYGDVVLDAFV